VIARFRDKLATWLSLISMVIIAAALLAAALGPLFFQRAETDDTRRNERGRYDIGFASNIGSAKRIRDAVADRLQAQ
jgi:hypothetical protein